MNWLPKKLWAQVMLGALACLVLFAAFVFALLYTVETALRSSNAYAIALSKAQNSPCIVAELGTPIIAKGFVSGSVNTTGHTGDADLEIPIRGPKSSGTLHAVAHREGETWTFTFLTFFDKQGQIQILPTPSSCN